LTGGVAQLGLPNISAPLQQAADAIHVVVFRCNVQGGPRGDRETFAEIIMEDAWGGSYPVIRKNGVGHILHLNQQHVSKCHDMTIILTTNSEVYRGYSHKSITILNTP
jgi:hypothetical protein